LTPSIHTHSLHDALPLSGANSRGLLFPEMRDTLNVCTNQYSGEHGHGDATGAGSAGGGASATEARWTRGSAAARGRNAGRLGLGERKSTRLNSSHVKSSY